MVQLFLNSVLVKPVSMVPFPKRSSGACLAHNAVCNGSLAQILGGIAYTRGGKGGIVERLYRGGDPFSHLVKIDVRLSEDAEPNCL